jgi:hypothetical protein
VISSWHKQLEEAALEGSDVGAASTRTPGAPAASATGTGSFPAATGHGGAGGSFAGAETMLDIAFARARSEVGYVIELARAHRGIPASGSLHGDNVWLRLGTATLRLVYSRRARVLVVSAPGKVDEQIRWNPTDRALVGNDGKKIDLKNYLDSALDTTIRAWKAGPLSERAPEKSGGERAPMPTLEDDLRDEPEQKAR